MRRSTKSILMVFGVTFLVSCTDNPNPTGPTTATTPSSQISDAPRGGYVDFAWLPPTVAATPSFTAPFDPTALGELRVEVCRLAGAVCDGATIDEMTSTGTPAASRITLNEQGEYYSARWLSGRS